MAKFTVRYEKVTYVDIPIEAESADKARDLSLEIIKGDLTQYTEVGDLEFNCVE